MKIEDKTVWLAMAERWLATVKRYHPESSEVSRMTSVVENIRSEMN